MINLVQAKKQAEAISAKEKVKVYVIENGRDDYFTGTAPFSGWVGYYLNGEFIPNGTQTKKIAMAKVAKKGAAPKKAAKKVAPKKAAAKKVAPKKAASKKVAKKSTGKKEGKVVDISIKEMRAKMAAGFIYRDPQGVRQSEGYMATRSNQDYVRTGMLEIAPDGE